jgi:hypothetical protein
LANQRYIGVQRARFLEGISFQILKQFCPQALSSHLHAPKVLLKNAILAAFASRGPSTRNLSCTISKQGYCATFTDTSSTFDDSPIVICREQKNGISFSSFT